MKFKKKSIKVEGRSRSSQIAIPKPSSSSIPRSVSLLDHQEDHYESDSIDSSEDETCCIRCHGNGQLLVCSEKGCPIVLHEKCIGNGPIFYDMGKFYCPYCLYKRELARTRESRRKAKEAMEALSSFLDSEAVGSDKGKEKDRRTNAAAKPDRISERHQLEILEDGEGLQAEDSRQHEDGQHEGVVEDKQQAEPSNACHIEEDAAMDGSLLNTSTKRAEDNAEVSEESPCRMKEQMQPQVQEKTFSAIRGSSELDIHTNANVGVDKSDLDIEISVQRERHVKQRTQNAARPQNVGSPRKSSTQMKASAEENARNQLENQNTSKESRGFTEKNVRNHKEKATIKSKPEQNRTSWVGRRKKLYWTIKEEEMLMAGVHKFGSTVNKNIPWRKILGDGLGIFDPTRTPSDLKDKWKKLNK